MDLNTDNHLLKAEQITNLLLKGWQRTKKRFRFSLLFLLTGIFMLGFLILFFIEFNGYLSPALKISAVLLSAVIGLIIVIRFAKSNPVGNFYRYLDDFALTAGKLEKPILNTIDLYNDEEQRESFFFDAALKSNTDQIDPDDLEKKLNKYNRQGIHSKMFMGSSLLVILAGISLMFAGYANPDAMNRTTALFQEFEQPNPFEYQIEPGSVTMEQGAIMIPEITFTGSQTPNNVTLSFKTDVEESYRERQMTYAEGSFTAREIELTGSISYHINMDGFKSETHRIDVQIQPRFENYIARVHPPSYTGLSVSEYEYPFSEISFYRGSEIEISAETNKEIEQLIIQKGTEENEISPSEESGKQFSYRFAPESSDTIRYQLTDADGLKNRNPFRTILRLTEDEKPVVTIREPTGTVMINQPDELEIVYRATDDFGITRAELHWEKSRAYVDDAVSDSRQIETPANGQIERLIWKLSEKNLRPRDKLEFWIRVRDNDALEGGKWGESQRVIIQVPSLAEFFDEMDDKERDVQSELDNISENFEQMQEEYERFLNRLRENPEGGFEEQELLESVTDQQKEIDETVKKLREQFEELRQEMNQSDSVSEETRRAYRELQELMDELDDPAFREALEELRRAMENMRPDQIEQALENVSFNEDLYRERLERTKELFKQLKMNSDLDKLAQQYEDMAERVKQEETGLEQLSQELENLSQDLNSVEKQLENLDSNPPKRSEEQLKKIKEEAQQRMEEMKERLEQMKQDAAGEMDGGSSEPSESLQDQQQQLSQQMQDQADQLRDSMQQMSGQQIQVNLLALQRSLYTLLELSEEQENLTRDAVETRNRSLGFVELARRQNYVKNQFEAVADTIFQISAEIPGVPNRVNRKKAEVEQVLNRAIGEMAERNQRGATVTSRESLGGINDLSSTIASLIDQLMDQQGEGGGGGGMSMQQMIDQMQQMSGDQQQLNQQLQDLVNDMQGERLTREESERLDQLARQQNEIRRQMQELQRSGALRDGDRAMSELQRMIEEMEDSINDMRGGMTDPLMIERQQNILSRMLSAEESLEQRGETEEREGTRADRFDEELPPDMTLEELQQEIRARLQDPNYTRFSERYERLIQRYFELLRQMEGEILP